MRPARRRSSSWRLPELGGQPIQSNRHRVAVAGSGAQTARVWLDYLRWDGAPDVRLRRPDEPSDFWRRAWVNGVSFFSKSFPQASASRRTAAKGMIIHGTRQWTDYRVAATLTVHLAEHAGVGVRVQGLRRYYAALLVRPNVLPHSQSL